MMNRTQKKQECTLSIITRILAQTIDANKEFSLIKTTTIGLEIYILIFLIVEQNLSSFTWAMSVYESIGGGEQSSLVIFWVYTGSMTTCLLSLIVLVCKPASNYIKKGFSISYIFLQVVCLLYQVSAITIFNKNILILPLTLYIIFFPFILFLLDIQTDYHLFGKLSIPLVVARKIVPFDFWKAAVLIFTIRYFFKARNIHQKYGYIALGLVQLWAFCYQEISTKHPLSLLYPVLTLSIALVLSIYLKETLVVEQKHNYLIGLVHRAKSKNKKSNEELQLSMRQKIKMLEIIENSKIKHTGDIFLNIDGLQESIMANKARINDVLKLIGCLTDYTDENWVKAQIQILKNTNIIKTFQLIGQLNPDGFEESIRLQSLKIKAQNSSLLKIQGNIDVKNIQQVNISLECFYQQLYGCVKTLIKFWQIVEGPKIKASSIMETLSQILRHKENAKNYLNSIKRLYPCISERNLVGRIQNLLNNYQQDSNMRQKISQPLADSKSTYNYLIIEQRQVKQISSQLLVDLQLSRQSKFTLNQDDILPYKLITIIYDQYEQYTKKEFYLPLLVQEKLVIKKANIHMVPSYTSTLQHLIVVQPIPIQEALLYDLNNDQIMYFTKRLTPNQSKHKHVSAIKSMPKTVFNLDFNTDNLQTLKKGTPIFCELNRQFQGYFFQSCAASQASKISLHFLADYKNKNNNFILIEMKSSNGMVSFGTKVTSKSRQIRQDSMEKRDKIKLYENQGTFCRIKNPYSENIREKIQNHKRNKSFSNSCILGLLAFLVVGASIATLVSINILSEERKDTYIVYLREGKRLNMEYQNLMKLYYDSHIRYFTKIYSGKVLQWRQDYNIDNGLNFYTASINDTIQRIIIQQFGNPLQGQKPELTYQYRYDLFNISATSKHNDIVGLLQETKKYLSTYNITFLVKNYDQIRNIEKAYRISSIVSNQIEQNPFKSYLLIQLSLPIIALLTIFMYLVLAYTKHIIDNITGYLSRITSSQKAQALQKIEAIMKSYPILLHFDSQREQECGEALQSQSVDSQAVIQGLQKGKMIDNESLKVYLMRNYVYGLLLLMMVIVGAAYLIYVKKETGNLSEIMTYMQKMQMSSDFVLTEITDALNSIIWKEIFNTTNFYGVTNVFTLKTHLQTPLPGYFNGYIQVQKQHIYQDLCLNTQTIDGIGYFEGINCTQIFDGSLLDGYSVVYENYRNSLTTIREIPLPELLNVKRNKAEYPLFIQASYARRLITGLISDLIAKFVSTSKQYCNNLLSVVGTYVQIGLIVVLLVGAGLMVSIYRLKKQCQLALDLLRIIPRETLADVRLTKQMIKDDFLLSLERL